MARERSAYAYFVHTTQGFLTAEELAGQIEKRAFGEFNLRAACWD